MNPCLTQKFGQLNKDSQRYFIVVLGITHMLIYIYNITGFCKIRKSISNTFQVKVALRSVLNDQDEETEILPHIKMSKDFEIFEPIIMHPLFSILPWDENKKQSYDVFFEVCYL